MFTKKSVYILVPHLKALNPEFPWCVIEQPVFTWLCQHHSYEWISMESISLRKERIIAYLPPPSYSSMNSTTTCTYMCKELNHRRGFWKVNWTKENTYDKLVSFFILTCSYKKMECIWAFEENFTISIINKWRNEMGKAV